MNDGGDSYLEIETDETVYEIAFAQVQLEITGRCNLNCRHCRAANQARRDMPLDQIEKITQFAARYGSREIVLSGGEPLLHRHLPEALTRVRNAGMRFVSLTTNGYFLSERHLDLFSGFGFEGITVSVSLDSADPSVHDFVRGRHGAFGRANAALTLLKHHSARCIVGSVRATVTPKQISGMEDLVRHAVDCGCRRIGFSAVQPSGRAGSQPDLIMTQKQKRLFLENVRSLAEKFPAIDIGTNDPLRCLVGDADNGRPDRDGELILSGCGAAATTFNVNSDGMMTPCAMLDLPMMNVFPLCEEEITERYRCNPIVHDMLSLNLKGKCGACPKRKQCGGCRARAYAHCGDYLAEDPDCWR
jgi:MoaA/NifB/PqqE/SkfB family radical SAM enzyme